jgi:SAM-dependent methyltransferase
MTTESVFKTHADTYADYSDNNSVNRDYDRPTILRLVGALDGKRILELGCAAGGLSAHLLKAGAANLIGVDAEPRMVELARQRHGSAASFEVADLAAPPLTMVDDNSIDVVVASLVLHYIADWGPLLTDLGRCLVAGGELVFSLHHPITGWLLSDRSDYHAIEKVSETWNWDGEEVIARSYRRSISAIFTALRAAGFAIDVVEEPRIDPPAGTDPELRRLLTTQPFFLYVRAVYTGR